MAIKFPYRITKLSKLWARKYPKTSFECKKGPLNNGRLLLSHPATLYFTLKGKTGRYILHEGYLIWQPLGKQKLSTVRPDFDLN